ncbi:hypothetical protein LTR86_010867 [Recurvomyces mirabilis]|nr:hypothetical protein LTR86_010867 [Recurvomyces mirabilis]
MTTGFAEPFSDGSWSDNARSLYYCNSGNCTFGAYSTLSVCSRCVDISSDIVTDGDVAALPDGSLILGASAIVNMTSDTLYPDAQIMSDVGPLIVRYRAIAWGWGNVTPAATECVAYWCVQSVNGTVVNGVLNETVFETSTNLSRSARTSYEAVNDIGMTTPACWQNNSRFNDLDTCSFRVSASAQRGLQNFLTVGAFEGPAFLNGYQEKIGNDSSRWRTTSSAAQMLGQPCTFVTSQNSDRCNDAMYAGLAEAFQTMSAYLSHAIRLVAREGTQLSFGESWFSDFRFRIRWLWMVYTATVVFLAFAFVISTIIVNRGQKCWKGSILPAIFHGIRDLDEQEYERLADPPAMRQEADQMMVTLAEWRSGFHRA